MMKKIFIFLLTPVLIIALLAGTAYCATTDSETEYTQTYEWNVSIPYGGSTTRNLEALLLEVTEKTNGRITFTVYPSNSLVTIPEVPDALKDGIADIAVVPTVNYPSIFTYNSEIIGIPFSGIDSNYCAVDAWYALKEAFPDEIQSEWDAVGAFPWFIWASPGYHVWTVNSNDEIRLPSDLAGHKIIAGKAQWLNLINANGGAGIQAAPTTYYESLEKGVADGVISTITSIRTFGAMELMNYQTEFYESMSAGSFYDMFFMAISNQSWNKLDPEIQQAFMEVSGDRRADMMEMVRFDEDIASFTAELPAEFNALQLTDEEQQAWVDAMTPINQEELGNMEEQYQKPKCTEMFEFIQKWLEEKDN